MPTELANLLRYFFVAVRWIFFVWMSIWRFAIFVIGLLTLVVVVIVAIIFNNPEGFVAVNLKWLPEVYKPPQAESFVVKGDMESAIGTIDTLDFVMNDNGIVVEDDNDDESTKQTDETNEDEGERPRLITVNIGQWLVDLPYQDWDVFGDNEKQIDISTLSMALQLAAQDPEVAGVSVVIDSIPTPVASYDLLTIFSQFNKSGKPLWTYINQTYDINAYRVALASDSLWTHPAHTFNLSGNSELRPILANFFERFGIEPRVFTSGRMKGWKDLYINKAMPPDVYAQIQSRLFSKLSTFIGQVQEHRKIDAETVQNLIDTMPLSASGAINAGLIDRTGQFNEFRDAMTYALTGTPYDRALTLDDEDQPLEFVQVEDYVVEKSRLSPLRLDKKDADQFPQIALVVMNGDVVESSDSIYQIDADYFVDLLEALSYQEDIAGVVVCLDTPGGSVVAAEQILSAFKSLSERKPVIISSGDYVASAGYFISMGSSEIMASPDSELGSVGVVYANFGYEKLLEEELSITATIIDSGDRSSLMSPSGVFREYTQAERDHMQKLSNDTHQRFMDVVEEGRPNLLNQNLVFQAPLFSGKQALQLNMIDQLVTSDSDKNISVIAAIKRVAAMAEINQDDYLVRIVQRTVAPLDFKNFLDFGNAAQAVVAEFLQKSLTNAYPASPIMKLLLQPQVSQINQAKRSKAYRNPMKAMAIDLPLAARITNEKIADVSYTIGESLLYSSGLTP